MCVETIFHMQKDILQLATKTKVEKKKRRKHENTRNFRKA